MDRFVSVRPALASAIGLFSVLTIAPAFAHSAPQAQFQVQAETTITRTIAAGAEHSATVTVAKGNTFLALLRSQHLDRGYCQAVIDALGRKIDVRHLHIGDRMRFDLAAAGTLNVLKSVQVESRKSGPVTIDLPPEFWQVTIQHREVAGDVGKSVAASLGKAGLPSALVGEIAAAMKYDRDLSGMLKPTSQFRVAYAQTELGRKTLDGPSLESLSLTTGDLEHRLYVYREGNNKALVDADGKGIAWLHFQRPVANARLTSPYGWRVHPVFGDRRFHYGIDLATAEGTPVYAAADGVVIAAGWHGNYGQFVRIRHSHGVETTYGHLSKIAAALKPGDRVKSGQVIGAVGETGVATGPHLYYEVAIGGERIDPLKVPAAVPVALSGKQLADLHQHIEQSAQD
jgi:murein DD-endopeptidase MepM/ murein hydrolase activator NlpD